MPWSSIMHPDDLRAADAKAAIWRWQRQHEGRRPNEESNRTLVEGWHVAESQGKEKAAYLKECFRKQHGHEATSVADIVQIKSMERRLNRLLPKTEKQAKLRRKR
jgi:hypothetical protein